jgi:hypothetical protein
MYLIVSCLVQDVRRSLDPLFKAVGWPIETINEWQRKGEEGISIILTSLSSYIRLITTLTDLFRDIIYEATNTFQDAHGMG